MLQELCNMLSSAQICDNQIATNWKNYFNVKFLSTKFFLDRFSNFRFAVLSTRFTLNEATEREKRKQLAAMMGKKPPSWVSPSASVEKKDWTHFCNYEGSLMRIWPCCYRTKVAPREFLRNWKRKTPSSKLTKTVGLTKELPWGGIVQRML